MANQETKKRNGPNGPSQAGRWTRILAAVGLGLVTVGTAVVKIVETVTDNKGKKS